MLVMFDEQYINRFQENLKLMQQLYKPKTKKCYQDICGGGH